MIDPRISRLLQHFGPTSQLNKLVEELLELALAIQHSKSPGHKCQDHKALISSEIADVFIMLNQAIIIYDIKDITNTINDKLDKTITDFNIK
jgi:NTP pyrophosphatase (non-canonical NTP hydrolase)